ncbi:PEP-utilizing enzyme, partial [Fusicatenibacter saccharivorans]
VILMRPETSPEDIEGMVASEAIVTTHGGMTSHAAVVARGMGKCCVTGCSNLNIDTENKVVTYHGQTLNEGDIISVD